MSQRKKLLTVSIGVVVLVSLVVGTVTIATLYKVSLDQREADLLYTVRSLARLMESVAEVDLAANDNDPLKATPITLRQFVDAHQRFDGIGETGDFTLAKREGDQIVFLMRHRHADLDEPQPVAWDSKLAEPMRRALSGKRGTVVGLDYRGETVVAAHEPVAGLDWGIVAKMDLAEIRAPFVRAGLIAAAAIILIVLAGVFVLVRVSNPLIDRLEQVEESVRESEKQFRLAVESSPSAMVMIDEAGTMLLVNGETERLFAYDRSELLGQPIEILVPERFRSQHPEFRAGFFSHPEPRRMGKGRVLFGRRSDGSEFPVEIGLNPLESDEGWRVLSSIVDITERKQAEQQLLGVAIRSQLLHKLSTLAADAAPVEDALQECVDRICQMTRWPVGHAYLPANDGSGDLAPTAIWHLDDEQAFATFRMVTEQTRFASGIGLPGRILESGEPAWIVDVGRDENFPRAKLATDLGVRGAFGFPVNVRGKTVAVLEFFAVEAMVPDESLLMVAENIGKQIGVILERKDAENALKESEERFRELFEHSSDLIQSVTPQGEFIYVNPAWHRALGYAPEDMPGLSMFDVIHPDSHDHCMELFGRLMQGELLDQVEAQFVTKAGRTIWLEGSASCQFVDGQPTASRSIFRDMTARRQVEERLRLQERAIENTRDGMLITDPNQPDNPIVFCNSAFEERTGYTRDDILGRNCRFLQGTDRDQPELEELRAALRDQRECQVTLRNYKKDDTPFWNELTISPVRDDEGSLTHFVGIARDITRRKQAEEGLSEQLRLAELEADVATALTQKEALPETLHACVDAIVRHLDAAFARIWTVNEAGDTLILKASAGLYTHLDGDHARVPVGQFKIGMIAAEAKPHLTNQVIGDERVHHQDWAQREGMIAFAGYPLIIDDRVVGVVGLFARHELSKNVLQALGNLALAIATGIRRKEAETQLLQAHNELEQRVNERTAELAASEEKFAKAFRSSPDAIMLTSVKDGRMIDVNESACRISGFPRDELIGTTTLSLSLWVNTDVRDGYVEQLQQEGRATELEFEFCTKSGEIRNGLLAGELITLRDGDFILSTIRDITKVKRTEQALRQHTMRLEVVGDIIQSVLEARSTEQIATAVLERLGELVPCDRSSVVLFDSQFERATLLAVHSDSDTRIRPGMEVPIDIFGDIESLRKGETYQFNDLEQEASRSAVRKMLFDEGVRASVSVPLLVEGDLVGILNFGVDEPGRISDEHRTIVLEVTKPLAVGIRLSQLHQQVLDHAEELEDRVALRTVELADAKERAESADRVKSAFLATMSHELRTPLNSIIGFTGIVEKELAGPLNDEQKKQLGMVLNSSRHLLNLINDVLDLSKIEAGQLEVEQDGFPIEESLAHCVEMVEPLAKQKGLAVEIRVANKLGDVESDRRRVEQVVINLLNNAVKFTDQGTVTLIAERLPAVNSKPPCVVIKVNDTGTGIDPGQQQKLFQPFQQLQQGLARPHEGTGLGLSICKRLLDLLGGEINVESEMGRGSTFSVTLPLDSRDSPSAEV